VVFICPRALASPPPGSGPPHKVQDSAAVADATEKSSRQEENTKIQQSTIFGGYLDAKFK